MAEENKSQEFRLKNIDQTRNDFIEEVNQNDLVSNKHKKVCADLNYVQHLLPSWQIFVSRTSQRRPLKIIFDQMGDIPV